MLVIEDEALVPIREVWMISSPRLEPNTEWSRTLDNFYCLILMFWRALASPWLSF